jgi:hypothetical protein
VGEGEGTEQAHGKYLWSTTTTMRRRCVCDCFLSVSAGLELWNCLTHLQFLSKDHEDLLQIKFSITSLTLLLSSCPLGRQARSVSICPPHPFSCTYSLAFPASVSRLSQCLWLEHLLLHFCQSLASNTDSHRKPS